MLGLGKKLLKVFVSDFQAMFHHLECSNWLLLYDVNKSLFGEGKFRKTKCEGGKYPMLSTKAEVLCLCLFYHIVIMLPPIT